MMVTEKKFLVRYCQKLWAASRKKYLSFWKMAGLPFR